MQIKEDRRQFTRLRTEFILRCRVAEEKQAQENTGTAKNISPVGIFFESKNLYSINTVLEIELDLPALAKKVKILAIVLRVEELLKKDTYGIGVMFLKIDGKDQNKIINYIKQFDINLLLQEAIKRGASDLHLSVNHPPHLRINGVLTPLNSEPLKREELELMVLNMLTERQKATFEKELELDIAYYAFGIGRFRANIHMQQGSVEAAIRVIPLMIKSLKELGLPPVVAELARHNHGLVLVTGPSGSGKSTTMAAMIDLINSTRKAVIISIEDPIEYIFELKKSIIKQREINYDTASFHGALKHILRQNPDIIFIGELRDQESIATAITAAEAGFLVLSTLHTIDAAHTVSRLIEVFPPEQQQQIKTLLSECLAGIIAQKLLPKRDGKGLVLAAEVLMSTAAVRNIIKKGETNQIPTIIQLSKKFKMQTMNSSIIELYNKGVIDLETAKQNLIPPFDKKFFYEARDIKNRKVTGNVEAIDSEAAIKKLQDSKLIVISIKEVS